MWISKYVWNRLMVEFEAGKGREAVLLDRLGLIDERLAAEVAENVNLRERLIQAEGRARGAQALMDSFTVQVNKLQAERDQLLVKVLDPTHQVEIRTPIIGRMARIPGSADIFSDPAEHLTGAGAPGEEIPVDPGVKVEDFDDALPGGVFEPAAADPHKL